MVTDPISDMLAQIKNAALVDKGAVLVPFSNIKMEIAKILQKQGYLASVTKRGKKNRKFIYCEIHHVTDLKRVSKPSKRVYAGVAEIKSVRQGTGTVVLSTPKGLLTDKEARTEKVGGEVLFKIW